MSFFAIQTPPDNPRAAALDSSLNTVFPGAWYRYDAGQRVAATQRPASADQVAEWMRASGDIGNFVVFEIVGRAGWHFTILWDWFDARERDASSLLLAAAEEA